MSQLWPCHIASSLYNNTFSGVVEFMLSNFCEVRGPFLREMPFWCNSYNGDIIILSFELIIFTCTVKILSFWVSRNSWFLWYLESKSIYSNKILRVIFFKSSDVQLHTTNAWSPLRRSGCRYFLSAVKPWDVMVIKMLTCRSFGSPYQLHWEVSWTQNWRRVRKKSF